MIFDTVDIAIYFTPREDSCMIIFSMYRSSFSTLLLFFFLTRQICYFLLKNKTTFQFFKKNCLWNFSLHSSKINSITVFTHPYPIPQKKVIAFNAFNASSFLRENKTKPNNQLKPKRKPNPWIDRLEFRLKSDHSFEKPTLEKKTTRKNQVSNTGLW